MVMDSINGELAYLDLLYRVFNFGTKREDRTGTGTIGLFGEQIKIDLQQGFPLLTTKKVSFKNIVTELLWMLKGDTNIRFLHEHGCHIWDEWADEDGSLGPVYGAQWQYWQGVNRDGDPYSLNQLEELVRGLCTNPDSRRHIVTAWNPADVPDMALPPCHCFFQCYVNDGELSLHLYQRSADMFLGVPYNIASYALLTHLLAHVCKLKVGSLVISYGDVHIYLNHFDQIRLQLGRYGKPLPTLILKEYEMTDKLTSFTHADIELDGYDPHPAIKAEVSV